MNWSATDFVTESNRIEGIWRAPTQAEVDEHERFVALKEVTIDDLKRFVMVYQPNAVIRDKPGLDVYVGNHVPMGGGINVVVQLQQLLDASAALPAHELHCRYEGLHPFTDGNGRSGRALWAWRMGGHTPLGFLHEFYYQTLTARQNRRGAHLS